MKRPLAIHGKYVTLRDLAREYEIEPALLRKMLVHEFLKHKNGHLWRWEHGSAELKLVHRYLASRRGSSFRITPSFRKPAPPIPFRSRD